MPHPDDGVTIGLDAGTSGLKAVALDASGNTLAEATRSYPLLTPQPGWTEQDPNDWWTAAYQAIAELLTHIPAERVLAVAASGQMHGMVPLDDAGSPVRNALLWNDQRTAAEVQHIQGVIPHAELVARTGNPAVTGFQLPKVLWLQRHEPDAYARTRRILFPKDFLTFRLTGNARSEPTDASGAGSLRDVFDVMRPLGVPERLLATGGGTRGEAWVQLLADVLDTPIGIPAHIPGPSHGAAVLAWRHLGVEVPKPTVQRWIEPHPNAALDATYARYREAAPPLDADG